MEEKILLMLKEENGISSDMYQIIMNIKKHALDQVGQSSRNDFYDGEGFNVRYTVEHDGNDYSSIINYYDFDNEYSIDIMLHLTYGITEYEIMLNGVERSLSIDGYYDDKQLHVKVEMLRIPASDFQIFNIIDFDIHLDENGNFGVSQETADEKTRDLLGTYEDEINDCLSSARKLFLGK